MPHFHTEPWTLWVISVFAAFVIYGTGYWLMGFGIRVWKRTRAEEVRAQRREREQVRVQRSAVTIVLGCGHSENRPEMGIWQAAQTVHECEIGFDADVYWLV